MADAPGPKIPNNDQWDELLKPENPLHLIAEMIQAKESGKNHIDVVWLEGVEYWKAIQENFPRLRSGGVMNRAIRFYFDNEVAYKPIVVNN